MKTYQANLLNAIILIVMPVWAYLTFEGSVEKPEQSITAFIPLFFGVILLICNKGLKNESKLIAHIAVFVTLIALIGLTMPFKAAFYEGRTFSMFRVGAMILTGILAMTTFVKSFIKARQRK